MPDFEFEDFIEKEMLQPIPFPNKKQYYLDIQQIQHSFSGFFDAGLANTLIMESAILLKNAIPLFEKGYFDVAFYSLRQAVEMSTTFVYLYDLPENEKREQINLWKTTAPGFPMRGYMDKDLSCKDTKYADMKKKMPTFFNDVDHVSKRLNKYVHKQGFKFLYISRSRANNEKRNEINTLLLKEFTYFLEKCIGAVAVLRLAIDPFPVILVDEKILNRFCDSVTDPYSDDFLEKYIGEKVLREYYQTIFYKDVYDELIKQEEKNEGVLWVAKDEYIDRSRKDEILSQMHLLTWIDRCAVAFCLCCAKITVVYLHNGLTSYFTDVHSNRSDRYYSSVDFDELKERAVRENLPYKNVWISLFSIGDEFYFLEHNETLDSAEIYSLTEVANILDHNYKKQEKVFHEELKKILKEESIALP